MTDPTRDLPDDPLDASVRCHYARQALGPADLARLRAAVRAEDAARPRADRAPRRPARTFPARLAAASVVAVSAAAFAVGLWWPSPALSAEAVAREIALNHVKALAPDLTLATFEEARVAMTKLDFSVATPGAESLPTVRVTGARYCSLGGEMAAQFRLLDAANRPCTLYQVRDGEAFRHLQPTTVEVDGVRVRIWREAGLVMGLAEST